MYEIRSERFKLLRKGAYVCLRLTFPLYEIRLKSLLLSLLRQGIPCGSIDPTQVRLRRAFLLLPPLSGFLGQQITYLFVFSLLERFDWVRTGFIILIYI